MRVQYALHNRYYNTSAHYFNVTGILHVHNKNPYTNCKLWYLTVISRRKEGFWLRFFYKIKIKDVRQRTKVIHRYIAVASPTLR